MTTSAPTPDQAPADTTTPTDTSAVTEPVLDAPQNPIWSMVVTVGPDAPKFEGATLVDLTPADGSVGAVVAAVADAGLTPSDLRARVLLSVDPDPAYTKKALAVYAALCGFAGRRLDATVDGTVLTLAEFDRVLRTTEDAGRPSDPIEQAQVGGVPRTDLPWVDLSGGFTPQTLSVIRFAKRLRFVPPADTALALSHLVAIAAVRCRAGMDRFPLLSTGDEPVTPGTDPAGDPILPGVCLHTVRRAAEELRRSLRGDTRDAVADFVEPSPRVKRLIEAASADLEGVLVRLGSISKLIDVPARDGDGETEQVLAWHCLKPANHTHGDASPSARILPNADGTAGFRCFRCLPEKVDALRLVMWARGCTADEAADWILAA